MCKLFVSDKNTWYHITEHKKKQLYTNKKKYKLKEIQWNIENIVITIKHEQISKILALNNP